LNTASHHFYINFLRATAGAVVAKGGTFKAGLNAGFVLVISFHNGIFCLVKNFKRES
jgi:hypothetical protein